MLFHSDSSALSEKLFHSADKPTVKLFIFCVVGLSKFQLSELNLLNLTSTYPGTYFYLPGFFSVSFRSLFCLQIGRLVEVVNPNFFQQLFSECVRIEMLKGEQWKQHKVSTRSMYPL